jgi:predicted nucleotidyltransferase component of viral defense system
MVLPLSKDMKHKTQLFRLLREILNTPELSSKLAFKGGTYASLRGVLNRFSADLDFDLPDKNDYEFVLDATLKIISKLGLEIKDRSKNHLQFFLKYDALPTERNTLKLEINDDTSRFNKYEEVNLLEINQICKGQTLDTMFSNKLFACIARFEKNGKIAGRDFFDIHQFFYQGLPINKDVVEERSNLSYKEYMVKLRSFIVKNITTQQLVQDLNMLLEKKTIKTILPHIKDELLVFIDNEVNIKI